MNALMDWLVGEAMMQPNRSVGEAFHRRAAEALIAASGLMFETEAVISIGHPPKLHRFDLATPDRTYVGEVKAFTWTASGNVPSAKISTVREAIQFLEQLPDPVSRFIIMLVACTLVLANRSRDTSID